MKQVKNKFNIIRDIKGDERWGIMLYFYTKRLNIVKM